MVTQLKVAKLFTSASYLGLSLVIVALAAECRTVDGNTGRRLIVETHAVLSHPRFAVVLFK